MSKNIKELTSGDTIGNLKIIKNNYNSETKKGEIILNGILTEILDNEFEDCSNLTSITLPDTVTKIGDNAFYNCSLSSISLPSSLVSLGENAFGGSILPDCTYKGTVEKWNEMVKDMNIYDNFNQNTITCDDEIIYINSNKNDIQKHLVIDVSDNFEFGFEANSVTNYPCYKTKSPQDPSTGDSITNFDCWPFDKFKEMGISIVYEKIKYWSTTNGTKTLTESLSLAQENDIKILPNSYDDILNGSRVVWKNSSFADSVKTKYESLFSKYNSIGGFWGINEPSQNLFNTDSGLNYTKLDNTYHAWKILNEIGYGDMFRMENAFPAYAKWDTQINGHGNSDYESGDEFATTIEGDNDRYVDYLKATVQPGKYLNILDPSYTYNNGEPYDETIEGTVIDSNNFIFNTSTDITERVKPFFRAIHRASVETQKPFWNHGLCTEYGTWNQNMSKDMLRYQLYLSLVWGAQGFLWFGVADKVTTYNNKWVYSTKKSPFNIYKEPTETFDWLKDLQTVECKNFCNIFKNSEIIDVEFYDSSSSILPNFIDKINSGEVVLTTFKKNNHIYFSVFGFTDAEYVLNDKVAFEISEDLTINDVTSKTQTINYSYVKLYCSKYDYPKQWYTNDIVPSKVKKYLNDFVYKDDDYSYSNIENYLVADDYSNQYPKGVKITWEKNVSQIEISETCDFSNSYTINFNSNTNQYTFYNLIPNRKYYWRTLENETVSESGNFFTAGEIRLLKFEDLNNVRDIGGKQGDDEKEIVYGRIIRGETLSNATDSDKQILTDFLNINAVVDLTVDASEGTSEYLGENVSYIGYNGLWVNCLAIPTTLINNILPPIYFANVIRQIAKYLAEGKNIYLHCGGGADRTGVIAMLIEGLCGVSESDIAKDYEITSFSKFGVRKRIDGVKYGEMTYDYATAINYLKTNFEGTTLSEKIANYLVNIGNLEQKYIDSLRNILLK